MHRSRPLRPSGSPRDAGYAMPAEWAPHAGCLMAWPSRADLWGTHLDAAERDDDAAANAIAAFEPVLMVCSPGTAARVRERCGTRVTTVEIPIDDSWSRDTGPIFARDGDGDLAVVGFGFNAWGNRWHPYHDDARLAERIADLLGLPFFRAPFVLEGGSFFVDGEGTVVTTEQCLLHPNRNPDLDRSQIERGLCEHLGASTVIWLPFGHGLDTGPTGTDGHVDGVLQYVRPGRVLPGRTIAVGGGGPHCITQQIPAGITLPT